MAANVHCSRYFTFDKLVEFKDGQIYSLEDVHRIMHSVNQGEMTFQTMIFEPATRRLHVAFGPGPISRAPLTTLELDRLFLPDAKGHTSPETTAAGPESPGS
jgi:hypothetical protein